MKISHSFTGGLLLLGLHLLVGGLVANAKTIRAGNKQDSNTVVLPDCIKKLTAPPAKVIRTSIGARQFRRTHTLVNGQQLFVFNAHPSIGCHINEPASTKYYSDNCKLVASFPNNFSIKKGFTPFIAPGYKPEDFPEAAQGDYPAYFTNLEKAAANRRVIYSDAKPVDPFPMEKVYKVTHVDENPLTVEKGDALRISTKAGLKHYRNNKLVNTYKLVPQLSTIKVDAQCRVPPCFTTVTKVLVYYMEGIKRFVAVRNNTLLISVDEHHGALTPTKIIELTWRPAYGLSL